MAKIIGILLFILVLNWACKYQEYDVPIFPQTEQIEYNSLKLEPYSHILLYDSLDLNKRWQQQFTMLVDSLRSQKIKNEAEITFAIENFIFPSFFYNEPHTLRLSYLLKMIHFAPFNGNTLYWIKHEHGSKGAYNTFLFLVAKNQQIIIQDTLRSNRYHSGTVKIMDWNNDGQKDIQYLHSDIVQSTAIIGKMEEIYSFDNAVHNFQTIFQIEYDLRRCHTGDSILIKQGYEFLTKQKIRVKKTEYTFNCNNFEWEGDTKGMKKVKDEFYLMYWDPKEKRFLPE